MIKFIKNSKYNVRKLNEKYCSDTYKSNPVATAGSPQDLNTNSYIFI